MDMKYSNNNIETIALVDVFEMWYGEPSESNPGKKAYHLTLYISKRTFNYDNVFYADLTFTKFKEIFRGALLFPERIEESVIFELAYQGLKGNLRKVKGDEFDVQFKYPVRLKAQDTLTRNYGETWDYWIVGAKYYRIH